MFILMLCLSVAFLWGFFLSIYFCRYRLKLNTPWSWLSSILGGLFLGLLMVFIEFFIIWPPVTLISSLIGAGLILTMTLLTLGNPFRTLETEVRHTT